MLTSLLATPLLFRWVHWMHPWDICDHSDLVFFGSRPWKVPQLRLCPLAPHGSQGLGEENKNLLLEGDFWKAGPLWLCFLAALPGHPELPGHKLPTPHGLCGHCNGRKGVEVTPNH